MLILNANKVFDERLEALSLKISFCGQKPGLAVVLVGEDPASSVYVKRKIKFAEKVGIQSFFRPLPKDSSLEKIKEEIKALNENSEVHGILLQLPLPAPLKEEDILSSISSHKDVDGFTPLSMGSFWGFSAKNNSVPCTPKGIITLLKHYEISLESKKIVVVGRSRIVGRPMAELCLQEGATVTICHSKTKDLKKETQSADIVIAAIGKPEYFDISYFHKDSIVVDVGVHRKENGKLTGDVDFESVSQKIKAITPVPGGVGPMTIISLLENTYQLFDKSKS